MNAVLTEKQVDDLVNAVETFCEAVRKLADVISKFADDVKYLFDVIRDNYGYQTSVRCKLVKQLNKLGYDKRKMWITTRNTYLARSNC